MRNIIHLLVSAVVGNLASDFVDIPGLAKRTAEHDLPGPHWCENEPLATDEPFVDPALIPTYTVTLGSAITNSIGTDDVDSSFGQEPPTSEDDKPTDNTVIYAATGGAAGVFAVAAGVFFFKKRAKPASAGQTDTFAANTNMNPAYEANTTSHENPMYQGEHMDEWVEPEK